MRTLTVKPAQRITITQLMSHPWLTDGDGPVVPDHDEAPLEEKDLVRGPVS